jgi:hypothetical protein
MLQSLCLSDFRGGGWPDKGGLKVLMKSIEKISRIFQGNSLLSNIGLRKNRKAGKRASKGEKKGWDPVHVMPHQ